jgi:cobalt-zinc-cadmium resistance protein CzcA
VRRQLLSVKGVAEVSSFGGKLKQFEIAINPNRLQAHQVSINDILSAVENNNQNTGGAYIEKGPTVLFIRSEGLLGNKEDIENIAIKTDEYGIPVFVKDVADVKIGHATRYGAMVYNDTGEVSGAIVMMLKGANSNKVIKEVKERIAAIQSTLPEGVLIEAFLDRTKMVNNAIKTVETNLLEGALIVLFILVLFLGNLRAGFLVASVIPLSMLFAVILMNVFGVSGNLMSLGALDFGLIVDGAVIIVEAVMHQLTKNPKFKGIARLSQKEMDKEVGFSAGRMMNSAVFGQIIILIVYLPIFSLKGIEGKMFIPMAQSVTFALLGAFILSLTYIPMMSALFLSKETEHKPNFSDRIMEKLSSFYKKALASVLRFPKLVISTVLSLFVLAMITLSFLGAEFIPSLEEGDFAVDTRILTGSNLNTTIEYTKKAAKILKSGFPEVEKVVTKIGSGEVPTDPMAIEQSDMMIILKDKKEWTSAKTFDELAEKMGTALQDVPGITTSFQYPVQMRFNELMTGAKQDVVVKIFGEDLDSLDTYAHKIGNIVNSVEGAHELYIESVTGLPQIVVDYKLAVIAQYDLSVDDINNVVHAAFAGQTAGWVFEGEKRFNLVVNMDSRKRQSLEDVQELLVPSPNGAQVPLNQLANVRIVEGPNQIQREDAKRRIVVGFNIKGRDVQSIVNELSDKVEKSVDFPTGYYVTYGGEFENLNAATGRLKIAVPISLALIFILLYFAFGSIKHSLLIYSAIPLSAIGGIFLLALRDMPFSISAGVGFIALFGVAVLNGIVLITEFNNLKKDGYRNLPRIVLKGSKVRLRPVLMTASVASLGFLPMALSNGAGAEVQRPLATVVIGGLLLATFLTLFVLPVLYVLFEKMGKSGNSPKLLIITLFISFAASNTTYAQQHISLNAAIDSALSNNLTLKNEVLKADYRKQLIKASATIPQTEALVEWGNLNSTYTDSKFGISQTFSFPSVYSRQKNLLKEEWNRAVLNIDLNKAEIQRNVNQVFYSILYLRKKEEILIENDQLFLEFLRKSELRLSTGESNILERATAATQRGAILLQLNQLQQDIDLLKLQFQILLNTQQYHEPYEASFKVPYVPNADGNMTYQHPQLLVLEQEEQISRAMTQLEKVKLLPDLTIGYSNSSMIGNGADDVYYTASKRFQYGSLGIGIPIFYGAQKAKIVASKVNERIAEQSYSIGFQNLYNSYKRALTSYKNDVEKLDYFEKTALVNVKIIKDAANQQFEKGEIDYLKWVMLINQAISIQNDYLETVNSFNESAIQLNFLQINSK